MASVLTKCMNVESLRAVTGRFEDRVRERTDEPRAHRDLRREDPNGRLRRAKLRLRHSRALHMFELVGDFLKRFVRDKETPPSR